MKGRDKGGFESMLEDLQKQKVAEEESAIALPGHRKALCQSRNKECSRVNGRRNDSIKGE